MRRGAKGRAVSRVRSQGAAIALVVVLAAMTAFSSVRAQSVQDLARQAAPEDSIPPGPPPSPWTVVAGEVGLGTTLAAAAGYGVGLLSEIFCNSCDASKPGGDTPGILVGLPAGAIAGVWLIGRTDPPLGKPGDSVLAAFAGAAVFGGFTKILEEQSDGVRWSAVVFPGALAAMGWNRSRALVEPAVTLRRDPPSRWGTGELHAELQVVRLAF